MFENLKNKLQNIFDKLRSKGRLTEKDIDLAMKEIRLGLLEADVDYKLVKKFVEEIKTLAKGTKVLEGLNPSQQVIKIVHQQLIELLGKQTENIDVTSSLNIIMLIGLNGSGKTTSCAKLAKYFKEQNHWPLLVSTDVYRPAARKQLKILGEQLKLSVFDADTLNDPIEIAKASVEKVKEEDKNILLIDTAGRLHIDDELMQELIRIKDAIRPNEILLVVDAMTGQDAINIAKRFHQLLQLTGIFLTKMDGDPRGGAAISMRAVTSCPIKFIGTSEKLDGMEIFHPERMANRILGMGDILSLIEKVEKGISTKEADAIAKKLREKTFNLNDLLTQLKQIKKMGPLDQLLEMIPGVSHYGKNIKVDEKEIHRFEAIINSMTKEERENPYILDSSRKKRIVTGSGTSIQLVNQLLKRFQAMQKMMKQLNEKKFLEKIRY